jgi:ubiquinone/menaquinone biosynthesis C-methylase UbiE
MNAQPPASSSATALADDQQKEFVRDHFHRLSGNWNEVYFGEDLQSVHIQLRQAIVLDYIAGLGLPGAARVLEVGCGAGRTTLKLAELGYHVSALDFAPNMLTTARANCGSGPRRYPVSFLAGDAEQLPIQSSSADLIVMMGVIGYLTNWRQSLHELFRVLKPGGYLVITCPNKLGLSHLVNPESLRLGLWKDRLLGRKRRPTAFSLRHAPAAFDRNLEQVGFSVRSSVSHTYGPFCPLGQDILPEKASVMVHRLLQRLANVRLIPYLHRLGKHYIVVAGKPATRSSEKLEAGNTFDARRQ